MPCAVLSTAVHARARPGRAVVARQRDRDGLWTTVRSSLLNTGCVAVSIERSGPTDVLALTARIAGLTPRETQLLASLYQGHDTHSIATALHISELTVQDHVKSILVKTGAASRRELLARFLPPLSS